MTYTRELHSMVLFPNGLVFAIGGSGPASNGQKTELYNPNLGTWSAGASMISVRDSFPATFMANGSVLVSEAGTAGGDAKMIYFSPDMKPILDATSYYLPTPFVSMSNTYSGWLTMRAAPDEDEPQLVIESRAPGEKDPYITITLRYQHERVIDLPVPAEITADAAARIGLIARTMGIDSAVPLQNLLADIAKTFPWQEVPHYVPASAPASSPAPAASR